MKVVSTFHSASSVVDSLRFRLADEQASEYLVVAKLNRLDIYSLLPEGLRHEQGIDIWGRVRVIRAVPVVVSNGQKYLRFRTETCVGLEQRQSQPAHAYRSSRARAHIPIFHSEWHRIDGTQSHQISLII